MLYSVDMLDVIFQNWVKAEVSTQPQEIIGVSKANVIAMFNDHVLTHNMLLQVQNCGLRPS